MYQIKHKEMCFIWYFLTFQAILFVQFVFKNKRADTRQPSYILHLTSRRSSLQLPASRTAALVATLASATIGDVLLARCSGSSLRVNLLPTYLVGELAAELRGYGATQSAPSVGSVQHLGGCHV